MEVFKPIYNTVPRQSLGCKRRGRQAHKRSWIPYAGTKTANFNGSHIQVSFSWLLKAYRQHSLHTEMVTKRTSASDNTTHPSTLFHRSIKRCQFCAMWQQYASALHRVPALPDINHLSLHYVTQTCPQSGSSEIHPLDINDQSRETMCV